MVNKKKAKGLNQIVVNDIFDELTQENQRLINELIFAKKCLKVFDDLKTHLNKIHTNYEVFICSEDKQEFQELIQKCGSIVQNTEQIENKSVPDSKPAETSLSSNQLIETSSAIEPFERAIEINSNDFLFESSDPIRDYQKFIPSFEEREQYYDPNVESYVCPKCGQQLPTSPFVLMHFYRYHRKPDLCCDNPYCNQMLSTKSELKKHSRSHRKEILYCSKENCSYQTKDGLELRVHLMTHSIVNLFKCDINGCTHSYKRLSSLGHHMISHKKPVKIIETEKVLNDKNYDRTLGLYKCPINDCLKTFHKRRNLMAHLKRHDDKKYKCTICSRNFRSSQSCDSHMKRHLNDKPFECTQVDCDFRTTQEKYLKTHLVNVHMYEYLLKCDFIGCGKTYKTQSQLNCHKKVHLSQPVIKCKFPSCDQRFYSYSELTRHHAVVHNKIKPKRVYNHSLPCDWPGCEYVATMRHKLVLHRKLHTGEKPYVCEFPNCGKSFRLRSGYVEHRNTHYNLKPFKCNWPGCQYGSAFSANVIKHVKQVHKRVTNSSVQNSELNASST